MIKLYATAQNGTSAVQLDILEDENISISFLVDDIKEAGAKNSSYSKDFKLPATKHNNTFFEHFNSLDRYTVNFNPNLTLKAYLEVDGSILIDGFLEVLGVDKKGEAYYYKTVIYDDTSNLFETLADNTIADLTFENIGHTKYKFNFNQATGGADPNVNYDNISNSWSSLGVFTDNMALPPLLPIVGDRTNDVFYPLNYNDSVSENLFGYPVAAQHANNYPITLKLKKIIDTIFSHAGYTYNSSFFDSVDFSNIYFLPPVLQQYLNSNSLEPVAATGIATAGATIGNTNATAYTIKCDTEVADPDSEYNLTTGVFVADTDYSLSINFNCVIKVYQAGNSNMSLIAVVSNDDVLPNGEYVLSTLAMGGYAALPQYVSRSFYGVLTLSEGAIVTFKLRGEGGLQYEIAEQANTVGQAIDSPFAFLTIYRNDLVTPSDRFRELCKDIKLVDILKDCFKMFNLVAETTDIKNKLLIETYSTFVDLYGTLDWSDKIDMKDAMIEPIKPVKSIEFNFAEDSDDFYLKQYSANEGANYGDLKILINPDASEEVKIELECFAPAFGDLTLDMEVPIGYVLHTGLEDDGTTSSFKNKPRLFYRNPLPSFYGSGITLWDATAVVWNGPNEVLVQDQFSSGSIYDNGFFVNQNTNMLTFGVVNDYTNQLLQITPINTLFSRFYFDYIKERYDNEDGILYTLKIELTAKDIQDFSFGKKIRIKSQEYRVNSIQYNTSVNKLSKIELFRI